MTHKKPKGIGGKYRKERKAKDVIHPAPNPKSLSHRRDAEDAEKYTIIPAISATSAPRRMSGCFEDGSCGD